jgi:hypothetical protein
MRWWLKERPMFVTLDSNSLKRAEDAEYRELRAQSSVVRVTRESHAAFWAAVEDKAREPRRLRVVTRRRGQ